jgi:hypothetical protein
VIDDHQQTEAEERHVATDPDASPPVVAATEDEYVSLAEARAMFLSHGQPVTDRTLQRGCKSQHLICKKIATENGEKWFALKSSVLNRIAERAEFDRLREHDATSPDAPRRVVAEAPSETGPDADRPRTTETTAPAADDAQPGHATTLDQAATSRDASGRDASPQALGERERGLYDRLVETYRQQIDELAKDKGHLQADKEALLRQLDAKDRQIDRFFANEHDTKTLLGSFQSLVSAIWPGSSKDGERFVPMRDALDSGLAEQPDERT